MLLNQNPNTPGILRQSTVCYIASLVSRGKFVDLRTTKMSLKRLMEWIHKYIAARYQFNIQSTGKEHSGEQFCHALNTIFFREERKSSKRSGDDPFFCDLKAHGPFYAACQAAFYIFAFRHQGCCSAHYYYEYFSSYIYKIPSASPVTFCSVDFRATFTFNKAT